MLAFLFNCSYVIQVIASIERVRFNLLVTFMPISYFKVISLRNFSACSFYGVFFLLPRQRDLFCYLLSVLFKLNYNSVFM